MLVPDGWQVNVGRRPSSCLRTRLQSPMVSRRYLRVAVTKAGSETVVQEVVHCTPFAPLEIITIGIVNRDILRHSVLLKGAILVPGSGRKPLSFDQACWTGVLVSRGTGVSRLSTLILAGFLWSASLGCTGSGRTQTSGQASGAGGTDASPPQSQSTSAAKKRTGVWHHFGESKTQSENPLAPPPRSTSAWRRFGTASNTRKTSSHPSTTHPSTVQQRRTAPVRSADLEQQMYELMNQDRLNPSNANEAGGHKSPLHWNTKLAEIARQHSEDMIRRGYFDHVDPDGRSAGDRLRAAGITWQSVGENIAMDTSVGDAESAFMHEPRFQHNHRWNILNSKYTDVGVGIVRGRDGHYYITQEFMQGPEGVESSAQSEPGGGETRPSTRAAR